eukprot:SAG11_NODE_373_length_10031_cov_37.400020_13_plen_185_part_00
MSARDVGCDCCVGGLLAGRVCSCLAICLFGSVVSILSVSSRRGTLRLPLHHGLIEARGCTLQLLHSVRRLRWRRLRLRLRRRRLGHARAARRRGLERAADHDLQLDVLDVEVRRRGEEVLLRRVLVHCEVHRRRSERRPQLGRERVAERRADRALWMSIPERPRKLDVAAPLLERALRGVTAAA